MIKFDNIKEEDQKKEYRNMVSSYLNWVTNKYYVGKLLELVFSPVIDIEIKAKLIYKYPDKKVEDISSLVDVKISSINQPFYENEKECKTVGINLSATLSHDDILDPSSSFESNAIEYDIYDKSNGKMIAKMIREYNTEYLDSMKKNIYIP